VRPGGIDVQVKLTTLAGLDEHPALLPGPGVTLAPLARQIAFDPVTRPTWRWSVFDERGVLRHHGVTRQRPTGPESHSESGKAADSCSQSVHLRPGRTRRPARQRRTTAHPRGAGQILTARTDPEEASASPERESRRRCAAT
jgi:hypothetical protein